MGNNADDPAADDPVKASGIADDAIGVSMFVMLYAYSWCDAYSRSLADCDKNVCTPGGVAGNMISCIFGTWLFALMILVFLTMTQSIFIKAIEDPDALNQGAKSSLQVAFSWAMNLKIMGALAIAMLASIVFAFVRVRWEQVSAKRARRPARAADMKAAVRSSYVFNVAVMVFMIVTQMQMPAWVASVMGR